MKPWPGAAFDVLYHVGTMKLTDKGGMSYEGAGLSVSETPHAWVRIARLGGLPWWRLEKPGNKFLDYLALTKAQRKAIVDWGLSAGYLHRVVAYRVSWIDTEYGDRCFWDTDDERAARDEAAGMDDDARARVTSRVAWKPTPVLERRVKVDTDIDMAEEHVATVFAEDVLNWDGVYWDERLDPAALSAPRAVIVPSKVATWRAARMSPREVRDVPQ